MAWDARTRAYVEKRRAEGKSTKRSSAASSDTSPESSTGCSSRSRQDLPAPPTHYRTPLDGHRSFGKIERFHGTLANGWAFRRLYASESARRNALPAWLHEYNHHRPHTAIGNLPPINRLTNLSEQHS